MELPLVGSNFNSAQWSNWTAQHLDSHLSPHSYPASNGLKMVYRLFSPYRYSPEHNYPLFVYLHGRGERGSDNNPNINQNRKLFSGN